MYKVLIIDDENRTRQLIANMIDSFDFDLQTIPDGEHENIGYQYLKKFFGQKIVEPIKYHVLAKRYLARDKKYFDFLSDASKISLKLQGGVLNAKESKEFENKSYFKPSILLRKFDEAAKRTDIKMKSIHDYEKLLSSKLI